jgi:hypothetical protein
MNTHNQAPGAVLQMDEQAWRLGYLAGMKQQGRNPYPDADPRGWAWASGFVEGKANPDRLPVMRSMQQADGKP